MTLQEWNRRRRQLQRAFVDGHITLVEYEEALACLARQ